MAAVADLVQQQAHAPGRVGHQHIGVAVVVDVSERGAAAHFRQLEHRSGAIRRRLEALAARVAEHLVALVQRERVVRPERFEVQDDGAVHRDDVQPAVVVDVDPGGSEAGVRQARRADAERGAPLAEQAGAVVDVQRAALAGQLGDEEVLVAVVVEVAGVDSHVGLGVAARAERRSRGQRAVVEGAVAPVHPQLVLALIVGDEEIEPAVAVEIGRCRAEGRPELAAHPGRRGHVLEDAVPPVAVEQVGLRPARLRRAVVGCAGPVVALRVARQRVAEVVADEQIEPAVPVVVEERRRNPPSGIACAAPFGDVGEGAVTPVAEHAVASEAGQVQVGPAVVVHVAGRHAHAVAAHGDARLGGHVGEPEPAPAVDRDLQIVAVEPVAGRLIRGRREQRVAVPEQLALHEVDVEVAVVVVVEQAGAGSGHLGLVEPAGHPVEVHEVEAGLGGPVDEPLHVGLGHGGGFPAGSRPRCGIRAAGSQTQGQ